VHTRQSCRDQALASRVPQWLHAGYAYTILQESADRGQKHRHTYG
jgi:hypothetical protein